MEPIIIERTVHAPIDKVWNSWSAPEHITKWNQASPDWECPHAENDLRVGGTFTSMMRAKDLSHSFEFSGTYTEVIPHEKIAYVMPDGRKVFTTFSSVDDGVHIIVSFDPESINPVEMQRAGWQSILDSFKKYVEAN